MSYDILVGDSLEMLKRIKGKTVQTCISSPPYYGLRDYGVDGQIGLEQTPEEYVEKLVRVFRLVWGAMRDDGTLWLNLGDSYWGGKGASSQAWSTENQNRDTLQRSYHQISGKGETRPTDGKHPVIKPKDLVGIPWMVAFALRADGWYLRSEIIWHKPNPMPESVKDRPTKSHEQIFLLSKSQKYYYDADAVMEPAAYDGRKDTTVKPSDKYAGRNMVQGQQPQKLGRGIEQERWPNKMADGTPGRNRRDVWTVTTKPYRGAHFATFPPALIEPCVLAGSRVGDIVLDPFNGSGTTGEVAIKHGRNYIGIELNPAYVELTKKRFENIQAVL